MTNCTTAEQPTHSLDIPELTVEQIVDMRQQALGVLASAMGPEPALNEWKLESRTAAHADVSGVVLRKGSIRAGNCQFAVSDFGIEGVLASITKVYPQEASDYAITDSVLLRNGQKSLGLRTAHDLPRRGVGRSYFSAVRTKNALEAGDIDATSLSQDYAAFWGRLFAEISEELDAAQQQPGQGPKRQKFGAFLGRLTRSTKTTA